MKLEDINCWTDQISSSKHTADSNQHIFLQYGLSLCHSTVINELGFETNIKWFLLCADKQLYGVETQAKSYMLKLFGYRGPTRFKVLSYHEYSCP